MNRVPFEGTFTALVTPFRDGRVDEEALRRAVERQVAAGNGVVPCGTTGETPTLSVEEHLRIVEVAVEVAGGRVPVLAGAGGNGTAKTVELARQCAARDADGLLVVAPYYNRPTQAGLEAHFRAVAGAVDLGIVLYDVPGRTGVALATDTVVRLARVPNVVAIKDATGNVLAAQALAAALAHEDVPGGFRVLAGDDALTVPMAAVGAVGAVSVTANLLPERVAEVVELCRAGRWNEALVRHLALLAVHDAMFLEPNPIPIKAAMHDSDLLAAEVRLPLTWARPDTLEALRTAIASLGEPT